MELARFSVESIELASSSVLKQEIKQSAPMLSLKTNSELCINLELVYLYKDKETGMILLVSSHNSYIVSCLSCSTDTELAPFGASVVCNVVSIGNPHQIPMPFMIEEYAT